MMKTLSTTTTRWLAVVILLVALPLWVLTTWVTIYVWSPPSTPRPLEWHARVLMVGCVACAVSSLSVGGGGWLLRGRPDGVIGVLRASAVWWVGALFIAGAVTLYSDGSQGLSLAWHHFVPLVIACTAGVFLVLSARRKQQECA